jgi:glycolate oxidase FAD binding subunit
MSGATTPRTKMTQTSLLTDLQSIVGPEHAHSATEDDPVDIEGIQPSIVVKPGTYEEVAAVLRFANKSGLAVIPFGAGTYRWFGNIPNRYDIALTTSRLNSIVEYEPADLTVTCQAGATLDVLGELLTRNGQIIPFAYRPIPHRIGRLIALPMHESNLTWGTVRDFTIGLRVVTAEGRIIRTGGNVVKNVAGYDLTKLFIGSMGTLGVIVEATLKLVPAPHAEDQISLEFDSIADAGHFASQLRSNGLSLRHVGLRRWMSISEAGPVPRLNIGLGVGFAGTASAVERSRQEATDLATDFGGILGKTEQPKRQGDMPAWTHAHPMTTVAHVLPTLVSRLIDEVDPEAPGAFVDASLLEGFVSMTWLGAGADEDLVHRVRAVTAGLGGSLVVTGCDPALKSQIDVFAEVPPKTLDLMRRIKHQFDPNGILSPGRFVGKL